jgi:hypothetical protein
MMALCHGVTRKFPSPLQWYILPTMKLLLRHQCSFVVLWSSSNNCNPCAGNQLLIYEGISSGDCRGQENQWRIEVKQNYEAPNLALGSVFIWWIQGRKVKDQVANHSTTRVPHFIIAFPVSWFKVVISHIGMGGEVNPSMAQSLQMRSSNW